MSEDQAQTTDTSIRIVPCPHKDDQADEEKAVEHQYRCFTVNSGDDWWFVLWIDNPAPQLAWPTERQLEAAMLAHYGLYWEKSKDLPPAAVTSMYRALTAALSTR